MSLSLDEAWGLTPSPRGTAATAAAAAAVPLSARVATDASAEESSYTSEHAEIARLITEWRREQARHLSAGAVIVALLFAMVMHSLDRIQMRLRYL